MFPVEFCKTVWSNGFLREGRSRWNIIRKKIETFFTIPCKHPFGKWEWEFPKCLPKMVLFVQSRISESFTERNRFYIILTLTLIGPSDNLNRQGRSFSYQRLSPATFKPDPSPDFTENWPELAQNWPKSDLKLSEMGLNWAWNGLNLSKDLFCTPYIEYESYLFHFFDLSAQIWFQFLIYYKINYSSFIHHFWQWRHFNLRIQVSAPMRAGY